MGKCNPGSWNGKKRVNKVVGGGGGVKEEGRGTGNRYEASKGSGLLWGFLSKLDLQIQLWVSLCSLQLPKEHR